MPKPDQLFAREVRMLHRRSRDAFRAEDDDLLIKIVGCLCKVAESLAKLGQNDCEPVEIVLRGDPGQAPPGEGPTPCA